MPCYEHNFGENQRRQQSAWSVVCPVRSRFREYVLFACGSSALMRDAHVFLCTRMPDADTKRRPNSANGQCAEFCPSAASAAVAR